MVKPGDLVVSLRDVDIDDIHFLGKNVSNIADGFAVTSRAYFNFISSNYLMEKIKMMIESINFDHDESLRQVSRHIKNLMVKSKIPDNIVYKIAGHYADLGSPRVLTQMAIISGDERHRKHAANTVNHIQGEAVLLDSIRSIWAHLFEPRLIHYRHLNNIDHLKTGVAVLVEKI